MFNRTQNGHDLGSTKVCKISPSPFVGTVLGAQVDARPGLVQRRYRGLGRNNFEGRHDRLVVIRNLGMKSRLNIDVSEAVTPILHGTRGS